MAGSNRVAESLQKEPDVPRKSGFFYDQIRWNDELQEMTSDLNSSVPF